MGHLRRSHAGHASEDVGDLASAAPDGHLLSPGDAGDVAGGAGGPGAGEFGVLRYAGGEHRRGLYSRNPESEASHADVVLYYYMNSDSEFPASAQVPADLVLRACVEFMETDGELPSLVEWQPWPTMASSS